MKTYKIVRFDLKVKYENGVKYDGGENLEKELNDLAKEGYRVVETVEEYEGLTSRKAVIMEKEV